MLSPTIVRSAIVSVIAGLIYEGIYYLTSDHHAGSFGEATLIGAVTVLIAFVLNLVFTRMGQRS